MEESFGPQPIPFTAFNTILLYSKTCTEQTIASLNLRVILEFT